MGRTICLYYENVCNYIDNDPHLEEWYDYCHHNHCEICKGNNLNCNTCKDYVSGMHISVECINYNDCIKKNKCTDEIARNCKKYKEE